MKHNKHQASARHRQTDIEDQEQHGDSPEAAPDATNATPQSDPVDAKAAIQAIENTLATLVAKIHSGEPWSDADEQAVEQAHAALRTLSGAAVFWKPDVMKCTVCGHEHTPATWSAKLAARAVGDTTPPSCDNCGSKDVEPETPPAEEQKAEEPVEETAKA